MPKNDDYLESKEFKDLLTSYEESVSSGAPIFIATDELIDIADYYLMYGEDDKAAEVIDKALEIDPMATLPLIYKAREELVAGDIDSAKKIADTVIDKDDAEYKFLLGEILVASNKLDEADRLFRQTLEDTPEEEHDNFVYDTVNVFHVYSAHQKALEWSGMYHGPLDSEQLDMKGRAQLGIEDYDGCIETFNALLDKDPRDPKNWSMIANAQFMKGEYNEALTSSEFALAIDPNYKASLILKANTLCRIGNFEGALEFYKRYNRLMPDDVMGPLNTGKCLLQLGRYEEALKYLDKARANCNEGSDLFSLPDVLETMALAHSMMKNPDSAIECLESALGTNSDADSPDLCITKAHVLLENGREKDAFELYRDAIIKSSFSPDIMLRVMVSLLDNGQNMMAYLMFRLFFLCVDKDFNDGYSYMALCCWRLKKASEFIEYFKLAVKHNPGEAKMVLAQLIPADMSAEEFLLILLNKLKEKDV